MIILQNSLYNVSDFVAGLQNAVRGVLIFSPHSDNDKISFRSTAWLITDNLVVVPDYSLSDVNSAENFSGRTFLLYESSKTDALEADLISASPFTADGSQPLLLKLRKPIKNGGLSLCFDKIEPDEPIFLLQYPFGKKEIQFSFGRVSVIDEKCISYDADTEAGAGGCPIFRGSDWKIIGMHMKSSLEEKVNQGLTLAAVLDVLRENKAWDEIARRHQLADVKSALSVLEISETTDNEKFVQPKAEKNLVSAAVHWDFKPEAFSEEVQNSLKPLVIDTSNRKQWILKTPERQRLLGSVSLKVLRDEAEKIGEKDERQQVIKRILDGAPYRLSKISEPLLPFWLQAVRWFSGVVPKIPTAAAINRELEKRRIRSRLQAFIGTEFHGRDEELKALKDWYDKYGSGAMIVTGIGGVGKSALLAQFALQLDTETPLLWLDFDRPDLAPDDAVSVLKSLSEQFSVQLDDFEIPPPDEANWRETAGKIGEELKNRSDSNHPPLLILDGFEVAQYHKNHNEIWQILESILLVYPELRVIVSGRAPVKNLKLLKRASASIDLEGMSSDHAKKWLRNHQVEDEQILTKLVEITKGVPLKLKLAIRFIETDGKIEELPTKLPDILIEGFLYRRVLERVIEPSLKEISHDALVLRVLTSELIAEVLSNKIPEGLNADEVFSQLGQEFALVTGDAPSFAQQYDGEGEKLYIRSELRSATLKLLEQEDGKNIRKIDRRAVKWYLKQDLKNPRNAAELIYHLLRLEDVSRAAQFWQPECAFLLQDSVADLPEKNVKVREWLNNRLKKITTPFIHEEWEFSAAKRIHASLQRGLMRAVPEILKENNAPRSPESPLIVYDAWDLWNKGELAQARKLLKSSPADSKTIQRDRNLCAAFLAVKDGDLSTADKLLAELENPDLWAGKSSETIEAIAVHAARIRLTVNIQDEFELSSRLLSEKSPTKLSNVHLILPEYDVVLPNLSKSLKDYLDFEIYQRDSFLTIPNTVEELRYFVEIIQKRRFTATLMKGYTKVVKELSIPLSEGYDPWHKPGIKINKELRDLLSSLSTASKDLVWRLAASAKLRWFLATSNLWLSRMCRLPEKTEHIKDPLHFSIISTLSAYRAMSFSFISNNRKFDNFDELIYEMTKINQRIITVAPDVETIILIRRVIKDEKQFEQEGILFSWLQEIEKEISSKVENPVFEPFPLRVFAKVKNSGLLSVIVYLLGPDPLETLCKRTLGIPDNLKF